MKEQRQTLMKETFLWDMMKLPAKEMQQVKEKITLLIQDPLPDGKVKKQLTHHPGKPYRLRSGKYRIFYTFNQQCIFLFKLDMRDEATYKDDIVAEEVPDADVLEGLEVEMMGDVEPGQAAHTYWEQKFAQPQSRPLPEPITAELLKKLQVPEMYATRLQQIKDEEALFNCPGVDDGVLLKIHEYMFERPLIEVMQQPDLVLNHVDDLLRYKDGELLAFLLRLSPDQEKYASWSLRTAGPTLAKGGPGTGKSTVALYRIRSLLDQLLKTGKGTPHILFTTYTNALVRSSQQLLQQLLGTNVQHVRVDTADSIAYAILNSCGLAKEIAILDNLEELHELVRQAIAQSEFGGNLLQKQAQKQVIERMGLDYLLQEFNNIIVARQLETLEAYQKTSRNGRKLPLNAIHRAAVWQVYEHWQDLLQAQNKETWQQRRVRAASLVQHCPLYQHYDAVVVDEAQDLDLSALRMLIQLCKSPARLFITADANQSIYGSGFSWSDVHESLKFQGRTSILRSNYRSTAEIGEAAQSYLTYGALEPEVGERHYVNNGPLPDARTVLNSYYEAQLLASYFKKASRSLRLTLGACAVLCPTDYAGKTLASVLNEQGIEATYMTGHDLNLTRPDIKIMTLKSSKGLEFPIVAVAGFTHCLNYPTIPTGASTEQGQELLARERRTLFVGMTRAMRALLVVIPHHTTTRLLQGFDPGYWNFHRDI
jgi:superfamily I DNA/RNA helicase/mRNA-degrading endonuclease RelE of RelBE toxin-antitoxin system